MRSWRKRRRVVVESDSEGEEVNAEEATERRRPVVVIGRLGGGGKQGWVTERGRCLWQVALRPLHSQCGAKHNRHYSPPRWLLWGESRSLARNTAAFRRRFRLQ